MDATVAAAEAVSAAVVANQDLLILLVFFLLCRPHAIAAPEYMISYISIVNIYWVLIMFLVFLGSIITWWLVYRIMPGLTIIKTSELFNECILFYIL